MFADRTQWTLTPNTLSRQLERLRVKGVSVLDLTESNPTRVGLRYPEEILASLTDPGALRYEPSPRGLRSAREAVASLFASHKVSVDPDRILLAAGTSEAYSFLFRLLMNPGDEVLIPQPSYPLFEYLAALNDVKIVPYPLRFRGRWEIDLDRLAGAVSSKTGAVVLVHPNNPTGSCATREELQRIGLLCEKHQMALISDEVFAPYRTEMGSEKPWTLAGGSQALTFALGGLSKFMGLPQMKLAWIAATGSEPMVQEALGRLELIADTYLSVNTPVQLALPRWLALASEIQSQIRERLLANRRLLERTLSLTPGVQLLHSDGGWNGIVRAPLLQDEEAFVVRMLEEEHLLVHPGYFFDFEEPGFLVLSLLPAPDLFEEGVNRLLRRLK